jgi:hypothetical protein
VSPQGEFIHESAVDALGVRQVATLVLLLELLERPDRLARDNGFATAVDGNGFECFDAGGLVGSDPPGPLEAVVVQSKLVKRHGAAALEGSSQGLELVFHLALGSHGQLLLGGDRGDSLGQLAPGQVFLTLAMRQHGIESKLKPAHTIRIGAARNDLNRRASLRSSNF